MLGDATAAYISFVNRQNWIGFENRNSKILSENGITQRPRSRSEQIQFALNFQISSFEIYLYLFCAFFNKSSQKDFRNIYFITLACIHI